MPPDFTIASVRSFYSFNANRNETKFNISAEDVIAGFENLIK